MFKKKIQCVSLFVIILNGIVNAQPDNAGLQISRMQFQSMQVIPPSPEAAELGKYGNIPISLFTGTPSVSIPIVELKGNVISLPVSMSYSATGFKPEDIAPWTGLGWALNAGGVISRSVIGDPDMADNYFISPSPLGSVPTDEYAKQTYFESIRTKAIETQPDIYYYNFMGQSGKFLVYPDGTIINKEKKYLTITPSYNGSAERIYIVTDDKGFTYEFSTLEKTTIAPTDDEPSAPPMVPRTFISAWYLTKITAPYGYEELEFEYYAPTYGQSTLSGTLSNNSVTYSLTDDGTSYWSSNLPATRQRIFQPPGTTIVKKFLKKATLKKASTTIGYIDFESGLNEREDLGDADFNGERLFKGVKLYSTKSGVNTLIKNLALTYEYFGYSQAESPGFYRRLKLKTIQEISPNTTITPSKPAYTFYYNGESSTMPKRFTSGLDHWGFYNGQDGNSYGGYPNLIPTVTVSNPYLNGSRGMGANREADSVSAAMTVLQKITYPTGGYTSFEYEGHTAFYNNAVQKVGGVRIKRMIDHSFANKPAIVKTYDYITEGGSSSGQATLIPTYYESSTLEEGTLCGSASWFMRYDVTISANSIFALGSIQGSHIGYTRVTEMQTDLSNSQPLGKTVYSYEISGSNEITDHLGNGDLKKKQVYDNGNKLIEETVNTYAYENTGPSITLRKLTTEAEQSGKTSLCSNGTSTYIFWHPSPCFNPPSGYSAIMTVPTRYNYIENQVQQQRSKLSQQSVKVFDYASNSYLTSTKNFTYGNSDHNYPTLIEETSSRQDKVYTSIKYVADYTIGCSPQSGSMASKISAMKSLNLMSIPVEKLQYRENSGGGNRRYISGVFTEYTLGLPEKIYYLQAQPMPTSVTASEASCTSTQNINSNYRLVATMTYDSYMNLKEEIKTDDVPITYFWGYDKIYPVAKVVGKNYSEATGSGITQSVLDNPSSETTMRTELDKLRNLSGAQAITYTFKPMIGVSSETDPRGRTKTFEYDLLNRLEIVKDEGEIVQNYKYNYGLGSVPTISGQTLFYNSATQQDFTKSGCASGTYGDIVTYVVPYGKYASTSQDDANSKASADKSANGQAYANSVGLCRWYNALKHVKVFKNDCAYVQGFGGFVWYDVPVGTFKSAVSQADADAMAQADVTANGQAYANTNATCSCVAEGQRFINGVCETGQLYHGSSVQQPNGSWQCAYYYTFTDSYVTGYYYYYSSEPCPVDD